MFGVTPLQLQVARKNLKANQSTIIYHKEFFFRVLYDIHYNSVSLKTTVAEKKPWEDYDKFPFYKKFKNIAPILYYDKTSLAEKFVNLAATIHAQQMLKTVQEIVEQFMIYKDLGLPEVWEISFKKLQEKTQHLTAKKEKIALGNNNTIVLQENYF